MTKRDMAADTAPGTIHVMRSEPGIAVLSIDNPPANAMNAAMLAMFEAALAELARDASVRALVLTAEGNSFCSGADLKAARESAGAGGGEDLGGFSRVLEQVAASRVPVIAAINGHCIGGGMELALCCDIRIASHDASFVCAGVNVGLMASTYRLPRLIGLSRAKTMLLTGLPVDAVTAESWGLVTGVYKPALLLTKALTLARRIASRAPLSVEATKRMTDLGLHMSPAEARAAQSTEMRVLARSNDHREALVAFREKREPRFDRS